MLNIFLWISLYKSFFQSLMTIRQKSRRCRRSLILNTFLHVLLYLLHIDCLLNIKEIPDSPQISLYFLYKFLIKK